MADTPFDKRERLLAMAKYMDSLENFDDADLLRSLASANQPTIPGAISPSAQDIGQSAPPATQRSEWDVRDWYAASKESGGAVCHEDGWCVIDREELARLQAPPSSTQTSKVRWTPAIEVSEVNRKKVWASGLGNIGDALLVWVNEGDIIRHGERIENDHPLEKQTLTPASALSARQEKP